MVSCSVSPPAGSKLKTPLLEVCLSLSLSLGREVLSPQEMKHSEVSRRRYCSLEIVSPWNPQQQPLMDSF